MAELVRHRVGALVVSPGDGSIDGILSERDIVRCLSELRADVLDQTVDTVMSSEVHRCAPGDTVDSIMSLMTEQRIRHVPVVVDDHLTGIVSIGDVVRVAHRRAREGPERAHGVHHRALTVGRGGRRRPGPLDDAPNRRAEGDGGRTPGHRKALLWLVISPGGAVPWEADR